MPAVSCQALPSDDKAFTNKLPRIIPVQEKETITSVRAIKNIPDVDPKLLFDPAILEIDDGNFISNNPKKDKAKRIKTVKKKTFTQALVEMILNICGFIFPIK
jgi:hypothetical protein